MKNKIVVVSNETGDWHAIYFNGELIYENHSIRLDKILEALDVDYEQKTLLGDEDARFPYLLKDLSCD